MASKVETTLTVTDHAGDEFTLSEYEAPTVADVVARLKVSDTEVHLTHDDLDAVRDFIERIAE